MRLLSAHWPSEVGSLLPATLEATDDDAIHIRRDGRFDLGPLFRLRRAVADHHIDLVFCPHRFSGLLAKLANLSVPIVCSIRGRHHYGPRERFLYDLLDLHLMRRARAVVINSEILAQRFGKHPGLSGRVELIPNGVDLEDLDRRYARRPLATDRPPTVAALGRLVGIKEPLLAVDTLAELHRLGVNARLIWIGDGELRASFDRRVQSHGLEDHVEVTGFMEDPLPALARADVLLHPSSWENTSNAILEAMALSRPVVARDVGGNRETVLHGQNGLLADGNATALADALKSILADQELAASMGRAGRQRVETRHAAGPMVERHVELFLRCLRERRGI